MIPGYAVPVAILLLKSRRITGVDGLDQLMNDVDLLIRADGKAVYRYAAKQPGNDWNRFMDSSLDVRDVTGDGFPEILFRSGSRGASDFRAIEHILRYDRSTSNFSDLTVEPLYHSGRHDLRWLNVKQQAFAIVADENWSSSVPLYMRCHYCPTPLRYEAYVWSSSRNTFVIYRRIHGKASYAEAGEALTRDWQLIRTIVER